MRFLSLALSLTFTYCGVVYRIEGEVEVILKSVKTSIFLGFSLHILGQLGSYVLDYGDIYIYISLENDKKDQFDGSSLILRC